MGKFKIPPKTDRRHPLPPVAPVDAAEDIKLQLMLERLQAEMKDIKEIIYVGKDPNNELVDIYKIVFNPDNSEFEYRITNGEDGAQGPQGPRGEKGDQGEKGDTGEQGPKGDKGDKGDTGAQGPQGIQGEQGLPGEKGDKGDTGETGPQGIQGAQGPQGIQGIQGPQGEQGIQGETGEGFSIYRTYRSIAEMVDDAANVPEGKFVIITSNVEDPDNAKLYVRGSLYFTFVTDMSGAQGIQGPKGDQGIQGVQGIQGPQGPKGDSPTAAELDVLIEAQLKNIAIDGEVVD